MTFPVFGVTYAFIEYRIMDANFSAAKWANPIAHWAQQAGAQVASELRMIGIDAEDITPELPMYLQCQAYVETYVARQVAQTMTHQDPELAKTMQSDLEGFRKTIRQQPVGLLADKFQNTEHQGSFSGKRSKRGRGRGRAGGGGNFMM